MVVRINSQGLDISPLVAISGTSSKANKTYSLEIWATELMPIYRRFDLILLVVLLKLNEVI